MEANRRRLDHQLQADRGGPQHYCHGGLLYQQMGRSQSHQKQVCRKCSTIPIFVAMQIWSDEYIYHRSGAGILQSGIGSLFRNDWDQASRHFGVPPTGERSRGEAKQNYSSSSREV